VTNQNLPTVQDAPRRRDAITVFDPLPLYDTAKFEHMQRVAVIMAKASIIPDALKGDNPEQTLGNCFLAVNQAFNWNMDPFAVAQCMSMVYGKPCYEGKLIAAVIETKLGFRLKPMWTGDPESLDYAIRLENPNEPDEYVEGTVAKWHTKDKTGKMNANWQTDPRKMLLYRGTREWCRMWKSSIILGVYSDDEMEELTADAAMRRAITVSGSGVAARLTGGAGKNGFSTSHVEREFGTEPAAQEVVKTAAPADDVKTGNTTAAPAKNGAATPAADQVASNSESAGDEQTQADRNGPGAADTASKEGSSDVAASGAAEDPASRGDATDVGDGAGAGPGAGTAPAYDFKGYSEALMRATQDKSLKQFDADYRNKSGWTTDETAIPTLRKIYAVHSDRIKKKTDLKQLDADLRELGAR
jgi:hypothetical protein